MTCLRLALFALSLCAIAPACEASVEISTDATKNMSCSDGVCTPTDKQAVLNVNDLTNMLASGDVKITTGAGAVTITVMSPFSWTSTSRLTLDAYYNVSFRAPVVVAGTGAVTIVTNDGGSGGDLLFFPGAKLDFWDLSSSLSINGQGYTLVRTLEKLRRAVNAAPSGFFAFADNYDATNDGVRSRTPIRYLAGVFEGLGHAISNVAINDQNRRGATIVRGNWGTIRDIGLDNANIRSVRGASGLVDGNEGIIQNAYVTGIVRGRGFVGGLVLVNEAGGSIRHSHSDASVTARDTNGSDTATGGLVAVNWGPVDGSYATGNVLGTKYAGGLLGAQYGGAITDCYSTGAIQGTSAGGVAGSMGQPGATSAYAVGLVSGTTFAGGFIGTDGVNNSQAYWDLDTSGISDPAKGCGNIQNCSGVTGLTDAQLKSGLPTGFDPSIWAQNPSINNGYPYLIANPPPQ